MTNSSAKIGHAYNNCTRTNNLLSLARKVIHRCQYIWPKLKAIKRRTAITSRCTRHRVAFHGRSTCIPYNRLRLSPTDAVAPTKCDWAIRRRPFRLATAFETRASKTWEQREIHSLPGTPHAEWIDTDQFILLSTIKYVGNAPVSSVDHRFVIYGSHIRIVDQRPARKTFFILSRLRRDLSIAR